MKIMMLLIEICTYKWQILQLSELIKRKLEMIFFLVSVKFHIVNEYLVNLIVCDLNFSKRGGIQVVFRRFYSSP